VFRRDLGGAEDGVSVLAYRLRLAAVRGADLTGVWIPVLPHDLAVLRHLKYPSIGAGTDQGVAAWQSSRAGDETAVERLFVGRLVFPVRFARSERSLLGHHVGAVGMRRWHPLEHGRIWPAGTLGVVVKHHEMPGTRQALFDPTNVVLATESLVLLGSS